MYVIDQGVKNMLSQTKKFLKENGFTYSKTYIRPLIVPGNVYVFHFGREAFTNRLIIRYRHRWFGRQKIDEIDLRLHKQKHPRVFKDEEDLLEYLEECLIPYEDKLKQEQVHRD